MQQPESNFIRDYCHAFSGTMVPLRFHPWCAVMLLATTMHRKVYVDHGYFRIHPMMYATLVGRQGIRKSTAKDFARRMFTEVFPSYPLGSSIMSREQIVTRLASDENRRSFTDETDTPIEFHPMAFFIGELKNFMSIDPSKMVAFLTDIYDVPFFDADTIKHGLQPIINPCINILACETPKWIIEKLRLNIIAGGFSRRMLYVYETVRPERITFPKQTDSMKQAEERCKAHLQRVADLRGCVTWADQATRDFFDKWFKGLPNTEDEVLEAFYEAKDVLVLKIAMALCAAEYNPKMVLTIELLQLAMALLGTVEEHLPKLSIAVGRNELALPMQRLIQILEDAGGVLAEKELKRRAQTELQPVEMWHVLKYLEETEQIIRKSYVQDGQPRTSIWTPEQFDIDVKAGKVILAPPGAK